MDKPLLDKTLEWGMGWLGGQIRWSDCASENPAEWDYHDLEIFYSTGRCHDLALALHRRFGFPITVLHETDADELEGPGLTLPHHVFVTTPRGLASDIRGVRPLDAVRRDFAGTVGLMKPEFRTYRDEAHFRAEVLDRADRPLQATCDEDIARAASLIPERLVWFTEDYRRVYEEYHSRFREQAAAP